VSSLTSTSQAKIIWMAFTNFSGFNLDNLLGVGINEDHNLFMLAPVVHKLYDRLELWFNPLEVSPPTNVHDNSNVGFNSTLRRTK